jgi:hypothetical protein
LQRLNGAFRSISQAEPNGSETVTAIALQWGFTQLGRFSVNYRQLFGEKASETFKCKKNAPALRLADFCVGRLHLFTMLHSANRSEPDQAAKLMDRARWRARHLHQKWRNRIIAPLAQKASNLLEHWNQSAPSTVEHCRCSTRISI